MRTRKYRTEIMMREAPQWVWDAIDQILDWIAESPEPIQMTPHFRQTIKDALETMMDADESMDHAPDCKKLPWNSPTERSWRVCTCGAYDKSIPCDYLYGLDSD